MKVEPVELFSKNLSTVYGMSKKELYKLLRSHTNYLDYISADDIKQIEISFLGEIYILLTDGSLIVNGKVEYHDISAIYQNGFTLFIISDDRVIKCLTNKDEKFMNNNDYKYKKVLVTSTAIVALTNENTIKVTGTLFESDIDYTKYTNIFDIGYIEKYAQIVVYPKTEDIVKVLFADEEYNPLDVEVLYEGSVMNGDKIECQII